MRASASFSLEDGITTSSWNAVLALRMRVSMSAMGSVSTSAPPPVSPRCFRHAGHLACMHHLAQTNPAQSEAAVHRTSSPAPAAARIRADLELRLALLLLHERLLCHITRSLSASRDTRLAVAPSSSLLVLSAEREAERSQQGARLGVGAGAGDGGDVHAPYRVDLVVVDLREDELLGDPERVVAVPVEGVGVHAAEV